MVVVTHHSHSVLDASLTCPSLRSTSKSLMSGATYGGSDSRQALNLKQKRARSQLSCIPCRAGKLKCNRAQGGCDQCVKRGRESQCSYVPPPKRQKHTQNVASRVRQLESLVVNLMNQQTHNDGTAVAEGTERPSCTESRTGLVEQPTPPSDNDSLPLNGSHGEEQGNLDGTTRPFGKLRISKSGGEISYVGETHWQAILSGISDLKKELGDEQEEVQQDSLNLSWGNGFGNIELEDIQPENDGISSASSNGLGLMIGSLGGGKVTREQLIQAVPEKRISDRLCALWFNSPDPFKPIIHGPTFQEQYRAFWRDPKDTPTMWLGLLFAILSLASSFSLRDVDSNSQAAKQTLMTVNRLHTLAGSAAVLADFTKPKAHTMECLMLYGAGLRSNDAFVNVWLILGLIVRIGLRMGYHREHYAGICAFDAEMRRRVWAIISMIDVLISFQLGLPGMVVKTIQSDAQPPRNLLDRDFDIHTTVLPPSRGIDELTPSSYTRAKLRIVNVFAEVNELIHAIIPPSHEEMMELDRRLDEAKAAIPPLLRMPDMSELVTDPAEQLMCRCNLDLLYLKTKMVLHRRYMERPLSPQEQLMGIGFSRKSCVDAALSVLRHHAEIYTASQPGGQLESVKWYMGSVSTHDYLLAAMIVCLELSQQISDDAPRNLCPLRAGMMDALEKSQKIWSATTTQTPELSSFNGASEKISGEHMYSETQRASQAMSVMLEKVRARFPQQADALRKLNQNKPPQRPGAVNDAMTDFSQPATVAAQTASAIPLGGIVSYHNWDNTRPESLQYNVPDMNGSTASWLPSSTVSTVSPAAPPPGSRPTEPSQPNANDTSPDAQYNSVEIQYNMLLGNMLDVPGAIDWDMFDTGMTKNPSTQNNVLIAGNVLMNGGTGPGAFDGTIGGNGEGQDLPDSYLMFSDMSMDLSGSVDIDVGFDIAGFEEPWSGT